MANNRVQEERMNKLMTQAQLARKAKLSLRTIYAVEKGDNCRMETKRRILLAFGIPFESRKVVFPTTTPKENSPIGTEIARLALVGEQKKLTP